MNREEVFALEKRMHNYVRVEIPVKHVFAPGVCAREIKIPADTTLTGHVHKYETINILSEGEISVLTADGFVRVSAPFTVVSPAGTKRIAYAHTNCTWTTILATTETDPNVIEKEFVAVTEEEFQQFQKGHS